MGVKFRAVVEKAYKIGDKFLSNNDIDIITITGFVKTMCTGCSFKNIRYKCDGTKVQTDNTLIHCPFYHDGCEFARRARETNKRW